MAQYDEKLISELRYIVYGECSLPSDRETEKNIEEDASDLQRLLKEKFDELFGPLNVNNDSSEDESD